MPRYLVTEKRSYNERWLIEAESEVAAKHREGTIIDSDDYSDSESESIKVERVDDDVDML